MSYVSEVLADSPRGYWRMDVASGNITDSSVTGVSPKPTANHPSTVVTGAPVYSQTGAITTDAASKSILINRQASLASFSIPDHADLDLGDIFTLECWIKRFSTAAGDENAIISKGTDAYYLRLPADGTGAARVELLASQFGSIVTSTTTINDATSWYHIVATKNGATVKLYINGVDRTGVVTNATCVNNANVLWIGRDSSPGEEPGLYLDEIAVYSTALSAARILAHYNAASTVATAPTAPQSLAAIAGNSQVSLSWTAPASDGGSAITGYKVYRGTTPGGETLLVSPGTGTSYTDLTTVNGTTYYYKVSALNSVGESALSNEASALPVAPPPATISRTYKRFYGPTLLGNTATTLYTCPALTTAVIRHVHVSNPSASTVDFTFSIGTNAAGTRLWDGFPIPVDDVLDHYQDFSLAAGEFIQAVAGVGSILNLTVDGYEVGTVAPVSPIFPSDTLFPSDTSP